MPFKNSHPCVALPLPFSRPSSRRQCVPQSLGSSAKSQCYFPAPGQLHLQLLDTNVDLWLALWTVVLAQIPLGNFALTISPDCLQFSHDTVIHPHCTPAQRHADPHTQPCYVDMSTNTCVCPHTDMHKRGQTMHDIYNLWTCLGVCADNHTHRPHLHPRTCTMLTHASMVTQHCCTPIALVLLV